MLWTSNRIIWLACLFLVCVIIGLALAIHKDCPSGSSGNAGILTGILIAAALVLLALPTYLVWKGTPVKS